MEILIVGSRNTKTHNIAFTSDHIAAIKKVDPKIKVSIAENDDATKKHIHDAEIIIHSYGRDVDWKKAPRLKWVHSGSAGVTDLAAQLLDLEVLLTNSSGVHPIPISEWVIGAMLFFAKRFDRSYRNQITKRGWSRDYEEMEGFELKESMLGIVGYGRIGSQIGKAAKALGMKITAFEHSKKLKDKTLDRVYKNLNELLKSSDFVVDCLPLTGKTQGFFDLKKFKQMKSSAYFLNIGRGKTVAEKDLISALKSKTIKGTALDVTDTEPLPDTSPLWGLDNVLITPHISSWTPKYTDRLIDIFCENLKAYLRNKPMPNLVDKAKGY